MLSTVATFSDPPRAELARGRLESEGIATTLKDQHIVGVNWLYSFAVHGVKLQVGVADAARALAVLSEEYGDLLEEETSGVPSHCEACGSTRLTVYSPLRFLAALTMMPFWPLALAVGLPMIRWEASWRCLTCNRRW